MDIKKYKEIRLKLSLPLENESLRWERMRNIDMKMGHTDYLESFDNNLFSKNT